MENFWCYITSNYSYSYSYSYGYRNTVTVKIIVDFKDIKYCEQIIKHGTELLFIGSRDLCEAPHFSVYCWKYLDFIIENYDDERGLLYNGCDIVSCMLNVSLSFYFMCSVY